MLSKPVTDSSKVDYYQRRGIMLILSSPSGAGKTTLTRKLLEHEAGRCSLSISATTRSPRPGEVEGEHYFFMDRQGFESQREAGAFLESAEVFGNFYGTPRQQVVETLQSGRDVLFDIDWQGARQLAANMSEDVVRIFILPPSRAILEDRLRKRAADSDEVVARRLAGAAAEMEHWQEYDYVIVNDDLEASHQAILAILMAERLKRERNRGLAPLLDQLIGSSS